MVDKVAEIESPQHLHVIYLHGQIIKPEHRFILTQEEYSQAIRNEKHYWYKRAAQDYLAFTPIFIGSKMDEPILHAQLEIAKREQNSTIGRSYAITPEHLTIIKSASLRSKGVVHINATLKDFVDWLKRHFPEGLSAQRVLANTNLFPDEKILSNLTKEDLDAAKSLRRVSLSQTRTLLNSKSQADIQLIARRFLRGFPPTWELAASEIPVRLQSFGELYSALDSAVAKGDRLFVVTGQSGSGKTTATMMSLLRLLEEKPDIILYEVINDVKSLRSTLRLLKKIHDEQCVIFVGDIFFYGDGFKEDLEQLTGYNATVIATARSGEWKEHFIRHLGGSCSPFLFERFTTSDYEPLIERLTKYVPAPAFKKLTKQDQIKKFSSSKSQLLIALTEATESDNFTDVITNEFESLPDTDTKLLFIIVGVATLARVGLSVEMANEVYGRLASTRAFEDALAALDGIVNLSNKRLIARHEIYVRHIIENIISFSDLSSTIIAILKSFTKYEVPIIRNVNRREAILFKLILNHNFVYENAKRLSTPLEGSKIYEAFEIDFQLDGHFWLQYGLYLNQLGQLDEALNLLRRSIQAYPENSYAVHAFADLQLRIAARRPSYDTVTKSLIGEAVEALMREDAKNRVEIDQYPIVTLSNGHLGALIKHGQTADARRLAKQYFDRLKEVERNVPVTIVTNAKERAFRLATLGTWS